MQLKRPARRQHAYILASGLTLSTITCFGFIQNNVFGAGPSDTNNGGGLFVGYPPDGGKVPASSSFFIGAVPPGSGLSVNGKEARVNGKGFYAHVIPLQTGANRFTLQMLDKSGGPTVPPRPVGAPRVMTINRELPPPSVSPDELKILTDSISPKVNRGVMPGELVEFSLRATPGANVSMQLGGRAVQFLPSVVVKQKVQNLKAARRAKAPIKKSAASASATKSSVALTAVDDQVNFGMDAAYGKVYQRLPAARGDRYVGFVKIGPLDQLEKVAPTFTVEKGGKTVTATSPYKVTVLKQPFIVQTSKDNTITRVGPGAGRITPLARGVRLLVDGWYGDELRTVYAANKHVYIDKNELTTSGITFDPNAPGNAGPLPTSTVRTINTQKDRYGDVLLMPLTQRLPYQVEQSIKPNKLTLKIFGATQDTDWVSPAETDADELKKSKNLDVIDGISFRQVQDGIFEVTAQFEGDRQWGYKVDYEGSTLRLHVKKAPAISSDGSLAGLKICVDPGHGGTENGSKGCDGTREAKVNLDISLKFKQALERAGAKVIMTRTTEEETVSLNDRVSIAEKADADLLISVHNNALPDGRDPWKEHGTSTYWYHPQSTELARNLKDSVINAVDFPDIGCRFQNLALCRPTAMPAVLVEVGFMIHPDEYAQLIDPRIQDRVADGLLKGVQKYLTRK